MRHCEVGKISYLGVVGTYLRLTSSLAGAFDIISCF